MKRISWVWLLSSLCGGLCLFGFAGMASASQTCESVAPGNYQAFLPPVAFANYEQSEYVNGLLVVHFRAAYPAIATHFQLPVQFFDDTCASYQPSWSDDIQIPAGVTAYSVRFTSRTHYEFWNDDNNTPLGCPQCSRDIPTVPGYYSIVFDLSAGALNYLNTHAYTILEHPEFPAAITDPLSPKVGCPSFQSTGLIFQDSSTAEYRDGYLWYHFRHASIDNNVAGHSWILSFNLHDSDCNSYQNISSLPPTMLSVPFTLYTNYWSVRFTSQNHYEIWDDALNQKIICSACSGDLNITNSDNSARVQIVGNFVSQYSSGYNSNFYSAPFPISDVNKPIDPVIIIPGILGSAEKNGVWIIDPIFHTYDNLIDTLKANGYTEGKDLFTLPYDWRQSNATTSILLKQKIDSIKQICGCQKVDLVAHSMGGLVARDYIQGPTYAHDVDQLIFLGTPQLGAPKAYLMWEGGVTGKTDIFDYFFENYLDGMAKEAGYSSVFNFARGVPMASLQQLLPTTSYLEDGNSGITRTYPQNYPRNIYLENLNSNVNHLFESGVQTSSVIGLVGSSTVEKIKLTDPFFSGLWENGYPMNFDLAFSDRGLKLGNGDKTVPAGSASAFVSDISTFPTTHIELPTAGEGLVYQKLNGKNPAKIIKNINLPSISVFLFKILSPADLMVIAPDGKRMGKDFQTGEEFNEIPGAFYSGYQTDNEYITIPDPLDGKYVVKTQGTDNGGKYTIASSYISDATSTESDFVGQTTPGLITSVNVTLDNTHPESIETKAADVTPPQISILSPTTTDYIRSQILPQTISATDTDSGVFSVITALDGSTTEATSTDLFYLKLGFHLLSATATDFQNNQAGTSTRFRIIATVDNTALDLSRVFSLGWISNKKSFDQLSETLNKAIRLNTIVTYLTEQLPGKPKVQKKIERIEKKIDKVLGKNFIKELDKQRGKSVSEQAYQLLLEDINWLLDN